MMIMFWDLLWSSPYTSSYCWLPPVWLEWGPQRRDTSRLPELPLFLKLEIIISIITTSTNISIIVTFMNTNIITINNIIVTTPSFLRSHIRYFVQRYGQASINPPMRERFSLKSMIINNSSEEKWSTCNNPPLRHRGYWRWQPNRQPVGNLIHSRNCCHLVVATFDLFREGWRYKIRSIFGKVSKGGRGGVLFNPKTYIADFWRFKQGFLSMKLIRKSNFRVQCMFFSTIVLRKIKTRHTLKKALLNSYIVWPSYLLAYTQPNPL